MNLYIAALPVFTILGCMASDLVAKLREVQMTEYKRRFAAELPRLAEVVKGNAKLETAQKDWSAAEWQDKFLDRYLNTSEDDLKPVWKQIHGEVTGDDNKKKVLGEAPATGDKTNYDAMVAAWSQLASTNDPSPKPWVDFILAAEKAGRKDEALALAVRVLEHAETFSSGLSKTMFWGLIIGAVLLLLIIIIVVVVVMKRRK